MSENVRSNSRGVHLTHSAIIGIVGGALGGLNLAVFILWLVLRRRANEEQAYPLDTKRQFSDLEKDALTLADADLAPYEKYPRRSLMAKARRSRDANRPNPPSIDIVIQRTHFSDDPRAHPLSRKYSDGAVSVPSMDLPTPTDTPATLPSPPTPALQPPPSAYRPERPAKKPRRPLPRSSSPDTASNYSSASAPREVHDRLLRGTRQPAAPRRVPSWSPRIFEAPPQVVFRAPRAENISPLPELGLRALDDSTVDTLSLLSRKSTDSRGYVAAPVEAVLSMPSIPPIKPLKIKGRTLSVRVRPIGEDGNSVPAHGVEDPWR
ncbi:hypothetical protein BC834DRAFT_968484 [Gloeopeniophorella convolvens]|nr:hypothetical protein BC834DRAFT_968484 [Gloeopeniophorella convolvens]